MNSVFLFGFILSFAGMLYSLVQNTIELFLIFLVTTGFIFVCNYFYQNRQIHVQRINRSKNKLLSIKKIQYSPKENVTNTIHNTSIIQSLNRFITGNYEKNIEKTGIIIKLDESVPKIINNTLILSIISLTVVIVGYQIFQHPVIFLVIILPIILFLQSSVLGINEHIKKRKIAIENELFFFVIFCDIVDNEQTNVFKSFEIIAKNNFELFPAIRKESLLIRRKMEWFGKSINDIFRELSVNHPSKDFSDFIFGYMTNEDIGGKRTGSYFEDKINELFTNKLEKIELYQNIIRESIPMGLFMLNMIPMFLIILSVFRSGSVVTMIISACLVIIPGIMIFMIKKIDSYSPLITDKIPFRKEPVYISIAVIPLGIVIGLQIWEIFAISIIAWSIPNHILSQKIIGNNKSFENSIPRFVNELNQSISTFGFFDSFKKLALKQNYDKPFNEFLKQSINRARMGEPINDVLMNSKIDSWMARLVIQLISFRANTGIVSHHTLKKLSEFTQKWIEIKKMMVSHSRMTLFLTYFAPIVGLILFLVMPATFTASDITEFIKNSNIAMSESPLDIVTDMTYLLMFVIAFFSGLITIKTTYQTIHNSVHIGLVVIIMLGIIYAEKYFNFSII